MNIFFLEYDDDLIAKSHCDKHVVKMILESAQLLSASSFKAGLVQGYKPTHKNHPMTIWSGESLSNWLWLKKLALELCAEYTYRYGKVHKSEAVINSLIDPPIEDKGFTVPPQCVPDPYRDDDYVKAYRNYYMGEKSHIAKWTNREVPAWFKYP